MPLLTPEDAARLSPIFNGRTGQALARMLIRLLNVDELNALVDRCSQFKGPDFAGAMVEDQEVDYLVGGSEVLENLPEGAFITVSNHPYGAADGVFLIDLLGHCRPDFKVMVNKILSIIKPLEDNFITVVPTGERKTAPKADSISGIRMCMQHLRDGSPLGIFPSGAVSDLSLRDRCIRDREWQEPVIKLIRKAGVPVIPVRFFDRNSDFYYLLGLLSWKIRLLRLPTEATNKRGKLTRIGIGPVITVDEQRKYDSPEAFAHMLRQSVYGMEMPRDFKKRSGLNIFER